jgi:hypothetical protein
MLNRKENERERMRLNRRKEENSYFMERRRI